MARDLQAEDVIDPRNTPPINPLPPVVWLLALPMIGLEAVLSLADRGLVGGAGAVGWRSQMLSRLAFSPDYWRQSLANATLDGAGLLRLVSYPFVHGSAGHALFAVVLLLALGKFVAEVFRLWAVLVVFFVATVTGALAMAAVPAAHQALYGAYAGVYGLIGAFTWLVWMRLAGSGVSQFRAFTMIGILLVGQLIFGVLTTVLNIGQGLLGVDWSWIADLAGFTAGFVVSFVVSPGGWARVLARVRAR